MNILKSLLKFIILILLGFYFQVAQEQVNDNNMSVIADQEFSCLYFDVF